MENKEIVRLTKELKLKKFQFNSIYEFSSSLYSSFDIDNIIRIFFSTLMGQMAISKIFFFDAEKALFKSRGCRFEESDVVVFRDALKTIDDKQFYFEAEKLPEDFSDLKSLLNSKKIRYLVNISESKKKRIFLGLGYKFNKVMLQEDEIEFAYFIARFALIAIDNAVMINRLIENKRIEHEIKIAKDIQLSLLPQEIPLFRNFEIGVIYQPINEVGGDYYDILKERQGRRPVLIADVEGKGLPAALLAASSQAIFHSLHDLYFFEPAKFISKANSLIFNFTKGNRFITLFWLLIDDKNKSVTFVNAGHIEPFVLSGKKVTNLESGGVLTGFVEETVYQQGKVALKKGDIIVTYTDGVLEVNNPMGEEFGRDRLVRLVKANRGLTAEDLTQKIHEEIFNFSKGKRFHDDFTLLIVKAK